MMKNLILISVLLLISCGQETKSKEILFVCTHGAARSPIASAYFNKIVAEKNLNYHSVCKGTEPDDDLTEGTKNGLTNSGFEISDWKPEKVLKKDIQKAYKIITFDCELPVKEIESSKVEKWDHTPSISKDYSIARDEILRRVNKLIEDLPKE